MKHFLIIIISFLCFFSEAQQIDRVDFKTIDAQLNFDKSKGKVSGFVKIIFNIEKDTDTIFIDARNMHFKDFHLHKLKEKKTKQVFSHYSDNSKFYLIRKFKKKEKYVFYTWYSCLPKEAIYFVEKEGSDQIWTQGQGKYTSNWLPSIDDMNDKIEFDLSVSYNNDYKVLANGKLIRKDVRETTTTWHYAMQKPMSSYLVALAIGKYNKKEEISKNGIPLEMYYYSEDSAKVEPTYRYTKQLFDFLEEEIGVRYPWQNYKQVPVKDFLYSGMENTSLTIFNDDFMIDDTSFVDKNYVNVNAHELAHQWFGNLVTETEGKHHWLQEGFATYYALLAECSVFGDDYYHWKLYEYAQELLAQEKNEQATPLLDPKASSVTFYKKGAWVLHLLREKVGDNAFKKAVKKYLEKHQFKNVETKDFIAEVEKTSDMDLTEFVANWLLLDKLLYNEMIMHLTSISNTVKEYLAIDCKLDASKCLDGLTSNRFDASKIKIIQQIPEKIRSVDFENSVKVRQAIALNITKIPLALKADYETLLNDVSYVTKEVALYNLWSNFPQNQKKYLDNTRSSIGFNDRNVRTLWLTLALNTKEYHDAKKQDYYNELVSYTSSKYNFQLRQNAFSYLNSITIFNEQSLINLIEASKHHNWRFKRFAKELLERLLQDERYKQIITNLQAK